MFKLNSPFLLITPKVPAALPAAGNRNPLIDLPRISERGSAAAQCGKALPFRAVSFFHEAAPHEAEA